MTIVDCPDHPLAALRLDAGVVCCGCGREVVETPLGLATIEAPPGLLDELRAEWEGNATVAAFGMEARLAALGMLQEATDA